MADYIDPNEVIEAPAGPRYADTPENGNTIWNINKFSCIFA